MQQVTYQTVKLSAGQHASPEQGACVMELASMLADEPFSDHPRSVSRSIASFLRRYNDMLDDERRQDLYAFAARCVGTAAADGVEVFRAARLIAWGDDMRRRRVRWSISSRVRRFFISKRLMAPEDAAAYAIRALGEPRAETHAAALSLVDELIALGSGSGAADVSEAWPAQTDAAAAPMRRARSRSTTPR